MAKITPLGGRILVKPEVAEETTKGGLIIPDTVDEKKPAMGVVEMLGTGGEDITFDMKKGDTVYFKKYSPEEVEIDGDTYYIIDVDDVLAVIN